MPSFVGVWALALLSLLVAPQQSNAACNRVNIPRGVALIHGTNIKPFTGPSGPNHPRGPAWLTELPMFALHAGARKTTANNKVRMFHFSTNAQFSFMECETPAEFYKRDGYLGTNNIFLTHQSALDDGPAATAFCGHAHNPALNGYTIQKDAVRGEREYVFCDPMHQLNFVRRTKSGRVRLVHGEKCFSYAHNDYILAGSFLYRVHRTKLGFGPNENRQVLLASASRSRRVIRNKLANRNNNNKNLNLNMNNENSESTPHWDADFIAKHAESAKESLTKRLEIVASIDKADEAPEDKESEDDPDEGDSTKKLL